MPDQRENTRLLTDDELAKVQRGTGLSGSPAEKGAANGGPVYPGGSRDAAKQAVNEVFPAWTAQAALTKSVADQRKAHVFTASGSAPNILDIANRKQREAG